MTKNEMPKAEDRPDAIKGCVTRTSSRCTGVGDKKVCTSTSWDVCIES